MTARQKYRFFTLLFPTIENKRVTIKTVDKIGLWRMYSCIPYKLNSGYLYVKDVFNCSNGEEVAITDFDCSSIIKIKLS